MLLGYGDVLDGVLDREEIGKDLSAGKGRKGERTDELLRGAGHNDLHLVLLLHQQARKFRGFVGRDPATYAEEDFHRVLRESPRARAPQPQWRSR